MYTTHVEGRGGVLEREKGCACVHPERAHLNRWSIAVRNKRGHWEMCALGTLDGQNELSDLHECGRVYL